MRKGMVACQYVLMIVGFSALGYSSVLVLRSLVFQTQAYRQFLMERDGMRAGLHPTWIAKTQQHGQPVRLAEMALVGRLEIPSIHSSAMVAEGVSPRVLQRAVGHVPGTALPGQIGNVVLAGHRNTFFQALGSLHKNDLIELETIRGKNFYRVQSTLVVGPDDTWILNSSNIRTLTLVTCYPFHFIGAAPKRFIVRATELPLDTRPNARNHSAAAPMSFDSSHGTLSFSKHWD